MQWPNALTKYIPKTNLTCTVGNPQSTRHYFDCAVRSSVVKSKLNLVDFRSNHCGFFVHIVILKVLAFRCIQPLPGRYLPREL